MADTMRDEEKGIRAPPAVESLSSPSETGKEMSAFPSSGSAWTRFNERIQSIKFLESRGIERVPESERHAASASHYMQMTLLWFSTNITANNIAVGMYGPLDYSLGFVDASLCAVFGALLGAAGVAYMGTFGPQSGNRTMVSNVPTTWGRGITLTTGRCRSLRDTSWATTRVRLPVCSTSLSCWVME